MFNFNLIFSIKKKSTETSSSTTHPRPDGGRSQRIELRAQPLPKSPQHAQTAAQEHALAHLLPHIHAAALHRTRLHTELHTEREM